MLVRPALASFSSTALLALVAGGASASGGCTSHEVRYLAAEEAPDAGATPAPSAPRPRPTDDAPSGPWQEAPTLPADVRSLSCPTDDDVYAATSAGLYLLEEDGWRSVATGAFHAVHLAGPSRGYAGGEDVLVRLDASGAWRDAPLGGEVGGAWTVTGAYTGPDGAWLVGRGWTFLGSGGQLRPLVIHLGDGGAIDGARLFGLGSGANVRSISGSGETVLISGSLRTLEQWNGVEWVHQSSTLTGELVSTAVVREDVFFVTNGKHIDLPGGGRFSPVDRVYDFRHLFLAGHNLVGVGAVGTVLVMASGGGSFDAPAPAAVDLVAGCATSKGRMWVGGGKRVFARNDAE